jgi:hypothetical protein
VEFFSVAAQVIPVLLVVAAIESEMLSWPAKLYRRGRLRKLAGRVVVSSLGLAICCELLALLVLLMNKNSWTSCWLLRWIVMAGCVPALLLAWRGGHMKWMEKRDAPEGLTPLQAAQTAAEIARAARTAADAIKAAASAAAQLAEEAQTALQEAPAPAQPPPT